MLPRRALNAIPKARGGPLTSVELANDIGPSVLAGCGRWPFAGLLGLLLACVGGCGATVAPHLPAAPSLSRTSTTPVEVILVEDGTADTLLGETERLLGALGPVKRNTLGETNSLASLCASGRLVARVKQQEVAFASNASERNTLFIYETAIIVGIPVTLISAVSWPWYGEIGGKGEMETLWCDDGGVARTGALASVRAEGRGFISQDRLRAELEPEIGVALARKLVEAAAECGRLENGGERCTERNQ